MKEPIGRINNSETSKETVPFSTAALLSWDEEERELERIRQSNDSQRGMFVERATDNKHHSALPSMETMGDPSPILELVEKVQSNAWQKVHITPDGERAFSLDALPLASAAAYYENNETTAKWLQDILAAENSPTDILFYVGFEAFYHPKFEITARGIFERGIPICFSPLVKTTKEFLQHQSHWETLEEGVDFDRRRLIIHLGASHAMDRLLFSEDPDGNLQRAWTHGRMVIISPQLVVVDTLAYRAGLVHILEQVATAVGVNNGGSQSSHSWNRAMPLRAPDYQRLDQDIETTRRKVDEANSMEEVMTEFYSLVSKYVLEGKLDSPCFFDVGWEAFHMFKAVSQGLAEKTGQRLPCSRADLVMARNAAIGDAVHSFYATSPKAFPVVVCGDTAALLAGGISMINIHTRNRFGVVMIQNNRGMAIEDVISKRSVDGHQFQYEYVKLDHKKDIFTLDQLKEVFKNDVLASLRDHLWGISHQRSEALVLNIDVQSIRRENASRSATDAILTGSFLDEDFGRRFAQLEEPRQKLEGIVTVLHEEMQASRSPKSPPSPLKIQGCSAVEFMEIMSQLCITMKDKVEFLPTPTDLLATRTLLPSLVEEAPNDAGASTMSSKFVNSNQSFSVFISNAAFGLDGLNNLISTHFEYGGGNRTLVHLAYDAAKVVTHYSLIGQVHRNFGVRPKVILPSLYQSHQAYEGQILVVDTESEPDGGVSKLREGLQDPTVQVILVDMGAPDLSASMT